MEQNRFKFFFDALFKNDVRSDGKQEIFFYGLTFTFFFADIFLNPYMVL